MNVQAFIHEMRRHVAASDPDAVLALAEREAETIEPILTIEERHTIGGFIEWALMVKDLEESRGASSDDKNKQMVVGSLQ